MVLAREDVLDVGLFSLPPPRGDKAGSAHEAALVMALKGIFSEKIHHNDAAGGVMGSIVRLVERVLLQEALTIQGGNQVKAAQLLGLNRTTLRSKMKEYDI